jgi:hypothetical protein
MAVTASSPARGVLPVSFISPLPRFLESSKEKFGMRICPHDRHVVAGNTVKAFHFRPLV